MNPRLVVVVGKAAVRVGAGEAAVFVRRAESQHQTGFHAFRHAQEGVRRGPVVRADHAAGQPGGARAEIDRLRGDADVHDAEIVQPPGGDKHDIPGGVAAFVRAFLRGASARHVQQGEEFLPRLGRDDESVAQGLEIARAGRKMGHVHQIGQDAFGQMRGIPEVAACAGGGDKFGKGHEKAPWVGFGLRSARPERAHARGPDSAPQSSSARTTRLTGRPTTVDHEPSMRSARKAPLPWMP